MLHTRGKIMSLILKKFTNEIGILQFSIPSHTTVYLHKIEIEESYRNKNNGTNLLKKFDDHVVRNTDALNIRGMLWDDNSNPYLEDFFIKNNYKLDFSKISNYDDGDKIYTCTPIFKKIR